jgi:pimeloyl-ACP methyl ester carboxylesterase
VQRPQGLAPNSAGVPVLLEFETSQTSVYPPDGLLVAGSLIYKRTGQSAHLSPVSSQNEIELKGRRYPLAIDNRALGLALRDRTGPIARIGFHRMLHPAAPGPKAQVYLIEPYDPNKIPVLMVHGLQSTPVAFLTLVNAIRSDPELSRRFQVWAFLYGTGTPVLFNALSLREELARTVRAVDPHDHDFATRHIVVIGHSMGGLMAHTLVSSSEDKLWKSLFLVPPERLRGDAATIRDVSEALHFRRNPRVVRAIFMATPHRGSLMADSWIGHLAQSLIRLPRQMQRGFVDVATENTEDLTPEAQPLTSQMNFSAVRTLSPRDPVLRKLATLPIEVPFHSILCQRRSGPRETGSDGVVTYASGHLDGAASELILRGNHQVTSNPTAQAEVARILRLELKKSRSVTEAMRSSQPQMVVASAYDF